MDNKESTKINILEYPWSLLKLTLQHPNTERIKFITVTVLYTLLFTIIFATFIANFIVTYGDVTAFGDNFEGFGFFIQSFSKLVICGINRKHILKLYKQTKQFWATGRCSAEDKVSLDDMLDQTLRIQKLFWYVSATAVGAASLIPFYTKQFPFGVWALEGYDTLYYVVLGLQYVLLPFMVRHVVSVDTLFLGYCVSLIVQFRILKIHMRNLRVSNCSTAADDKHYFNQINSYIEHHIFLLRFSNDMRNIYSPTMMVQYTTLVLVFCAEMFIFSQSTDILLLVKHGIGTLTILIQLAFYCLPPDYVAGEAYEVAQAIYDSDWHSHYIPALKNTVPFIIQRAQKEIVFTAGGLYDINSRTLLTVFKLAWSVCVAIGSAKKV